MANAVMLAPEKASSLKSLLHKDAYVKQFQAVLPKWLSADRLLRIVQSAANMNPKIADCTPQSILSAVMQCAQLGLEPILGRAYLIPYKNTKRVGSQWVKVLECQFQPGYQGLIELAERTGDYSGIRAHVVYENDVFELSYGLEEELIHKPVLTNRGAPIGAYTVWKRKDGAKNFTFMPIDEIYAKHRDRSEGYKNALKQLEQAKKENWQSYTPKNPWLTVDEADMLRKSVIKAHSKKEKKSIDFMKAVTLDNMMETGASQTGMLFDADLALPRLECEFQFFLDSVSQKTGENFIYIADECPEKGHNTVSSFVNYAAAMQTPDAVTPENLMSGICTPEQFGQFWQGYTEWHKNFKVTITTSTDNPFDGVSWSSSRMAAQGVTHFWETHKDRFESASSQARADFRAKWERVCKDPFPLGTPETPESRPTPASAGVQTEAFTPAPQNNAAPFDESPDSAFRDTDQWRALEEAKVFRPDLFQKAVSQFGKPTTSTDCQAMADWISAKADAETAE